MLPTRRKKPASKEEIAVKIIAYVAKKGPTFPNQIRKEMGKLGFSHPPVLRQIKQLVKIGVFATVSKPDENLEKRPGRRRGIAARLRRGRKPQVYYDMPLPRIRTLFDDFKKLNLEDVLDRLLLSAASRFYETVIRMRVTNPELSSYLFQHLFFTLGSPPSREELGEHLAKTSWDARDEIDVGKPSRRVRWENALQNPDGARIREQVIAELENEKRRYAFNIHRIDEYMKFLKGIIS